MVVLALVTACAQSERYPGDPRYPQFEGPAGIQDGSAIPAFHVVARGETLNGIARRYGLTVQDVAGANGLAPPYALTVGQRLVLPRPTTHTVRSGDTLYSIARRYDVELAALTTANGIAPPYVIYPGQLLILPGRGSDGTGMATAAATTGPAPPVVGSVDPTLPMRPTPRTPLPEAANPPPLAGSGFLWPVEGEIISGFGPKGGGRHNDGINIAAPRGTLVRAAQSGTVIYAGSDIQGFGNLLLIKHADGWTTAYAHVEELMVRRGDTVARGAAVARVGSSGNVERPQLHFELRQEARAIDPIGHLQLAAEPEQANFSRGIFLAGRPGLE